MVSSSKEQGKSEVTEINTFPVPYSEGENKENITINTNSTIQTSKEHLINQAFKFHTQGNILEAAKCYQNFIDKGFIDHRVFFNYGIILSELGKLQEAEISTRKAIELNPQLSEAHFNLGTILRNLGKLKEAANSYRKTLEINPNFANAHLQLGTILKEIEKLKESESSKSSSSIVYLKTSDYEIIGNDMIIIDFMTPLECEKMIELAEEYGVFKGRNDDKVSAQELRLTKLGLWKELENHWMSSVQHIVHKYYHPCRLEGIRDAFIIKYSMDSQKSLRLHTDASLITGSIKLNNNYEGGELFFPRQGISNRDIEIGKCILFPGQCTHAHTSKELISGTKYSLTVWSKRDENDS